MARDKNELSVIQTDERVFAGIKVKIKKYTPDYLATFGLVSRTTFFKYLRGDAINPSMEKALIKTLELADEAAEKERNELLEQASALVEA